MIHAGFMHGSFKVYALSMQGIFKNKPKNQNEPGKLFKTAFREWQNRVLRSQSKTLNASVGKVNFFHSEPTEKSLNVFK